MRTDNLSVILAFILASTLTPVILRFLVHRFPAHHNAKQVSREKRHVLRNELVEFSGVVFFIAGGGIPFLFQQSNHLAPTLANVLAIFAFGILCMVSGMAIFANMLGDAGAKNFLEYCESERGMSHKAIRTVAKIITVCAITVLSGLVIFSLFNATA